MKSLSQIVVYKSADCIASVEVEAQWLVLIARVKKYQVVYEQSICRFGYNISRESLLAKYWLLWYKHQLPVFLLWLIRHSGQFLMARIKKPSDEQSLGQIWVYTSADCIASVEEETQWSVLKIRAQILVRVKTFPRIENYL